MKTNRFIFFLLFVIIFNCGCKTEKRYETILPSKISDAIKSSTTFDQLFAKIDSIELSVDKSHLIGQIRSIKFFKDGNFVACDDIGHNLLLFTKDGKLLQTIGKTGKGPGEFVRLSDIAIDTEDNLLVLDNALNRVSKFSSSGKYLDSFSVNPFAYFILAQKDKGILLYYAAAMPMPQFKMFVKYNQQGEIIEEFGSSPKNAIIDGLPIVGGSFTEDSSGDIYSVHISEYKINKFDSEGNLLNSFGRNAPFYKPITSPLVPYDTVQINSFTAVTRIMVTSDGVLLVFLRKQKPLKQWFEVYDCNGNYLNGELEVPVELFNPRCINNDIIYFEGSQSTEIDQNGNIPNTILYGYKLRKN